MCLLINFSHVSHVSSVNFAVIHPLYTVSLKIKWIPLQGLDATADGFVSVAQLVDNQGQLYSEDLGAALSLTIPRADTVDPSSFVVARYRCAAAVILLIEF